MCDVEITLCVEWRMYVICVSRLLISERLGRFSVSCCEEGNVMKNGLSFEARFYA